MSKKLKKIKLPDRIIPIESADKKGWTEHWYDNRNLLNFPHSWRMILCGPPSSGKSCTLKNIILRARPKFEEVIVVHYGAGGEDEESTTSEWDDMGELCTVTNEIPDPLSFERETKQLLVLEDLDLSSLSKIDRHKINRIWGYSSSHLNLSCAICVQNAFDVPVSCRRTSNIFVIWRQPDVDALARLASRTGMKAKNFMFIFKHYINSSHDSLYVDLTKDTPAKLRINGYRILTEL